MNVQGKVNTLACAHACTKITPTYSRMTSKLPEMCPCCPIPKEQNSKAAHEPPAPTPPRPPGVNLNLCKLHAGFQVRAGAPGSCRGGFLWLQGSCVWQAAADSPGQRGALQSSPRDRGPLWYHERCPEGEAEFVGRLHITWAAVATQSPVSHAPAVIQASGGLISSSGERVQQ